MEEFKLRNHQDLKQYIEKRNTTFLSWKSLLIYLSWFWGWFSRIDFLHPVEFIFDNVTENIKIDKVIFSNNFSIWDLKDLEKNVWLTFKSCEFKKEFRYDDRNEASAFDILNFDYCKFAGNINIIWAQLNQLNFRWNIQTNNFLTEINWAISFINSSKIENLSFTWMKINSVLSIKGKDFKEISFSSVILNDKIFIESSYTWLSFHKIYLDTQNEINKWWEIFIKILKNLSKSRIKFTDIVKLDNVRIFGEDKNSIWEIKINHINWKFNLFNFKVNSLKIQNSNLKDSEFNSLDIKSLYLINSVIQNSIFNWNTFPDNYKIQSSKLSKYQIKDNYRQLKFVMDKNGNYTEWNKFYSKEMEAYMRTLDIKYTSSFWLIKELYLHNFMSKKAQVTSEKISLIASYIINDFWNNWLRALQWLILLVFSGTLISGLANLIGNYTTLILFLFIIIIPKIKPVQILLWKIKSNTKVKNFNKLIDNKMDNLSITLLVFLFILMFIEIWINTKWHTNYSVFRTFWDYLNPIFSLRDYTINEWSRVYLKINWIENLSFVVYKILYWIIFWHLIVAAKRTTKR